MVADSTIEAKYIVASEAAKEGVWIRKFLIELGVLPNASAHWICTVITVGPLRKRSSQGIIRRANTLYSVFILLESSWNWVRSRYAKYTQT
jgi:hypothetical protein